MAAGRLRLWRSGAVAAHPGGGNPGDYWPSQRVPVELRLADSPTLPEFQLQLKYKIIWNDSPIIQHQLIHYY